ncbi:MAG TPA: ABC transporter substrate-binding protein [Pseudolabrys sp.]|jgi:putative ABC transport system substrate-binding protein|nr:ABC transporter substrate-binding protein [Pseudolabrys sp.]
MRRRDFIKVIAGSAVAWPLASNAQQADYVRRIGVLMGYAEDDPETKPRLAAFRQMLEKRGWSEGRNVRIETRFAPGGNYEPLAKELVVTQPDVILAHTTPVAAALLRATQVIPVVFVNVSDPIGSGFVANLARPGGNFTGVLLYEAGVVGKWLAMLKEIAPRVERVALVANPKTSPYDYFLRAAEAAATSLAIKISPNPVATAADIERTIESFAAAPNGALLLSPDGTTILHRDLIIALASRHKLPAVYAYRLFVAAGGLMSYETDQVALFRLAASYVDRILRGDKPADLPVQAPTKFETIVNVRTAKALDLTVPPGLLVAADEVLE